MLVSLAVVSTHSNLTLVDHKASVFVNSSRPVRWWSHFLLYMHFLRNSLGRKNCPRFRF